MPYGKQLAFTPDQMELGFEQGHERTECESRSCAHVHNMVEGQKVSHALPHESDALQESENSPSSTSPLQSEMAPEDLSEL